MNTQRLLQIEKHINNHGRIYRLPTGGVHLPALPLPTSTRLFHPEFEARVGESLVDDHGTEHTILRIELLWNRFFLVTLAELPPEEPA